MKHLLAGVFVVAASVAQAQPVAVSLTAAQISALLTGNTAVGDWNGTPYRQYFGADGVTLFAQPGARTARGDWRVDAAANRYESLWPGDTDWEGWVISQWQGDYYWLSRTTPPTPFTIIDGQSLSFE